MSVTLSTESFRRLVSATRAREDVSADSWKQTKNRKGGAARATATKREIYLIRNARRAHDKQARIDALETIRLLSVGLMLPPEVVEQHWKGEDT